MDPTGIEVLSTFLIEVICKQLFATGALNNGRSGVRGKVTLSFF